MLKARRGVFYKKTQNKHDVFSEIDLKNKSRRAMASSSSSQTARGKARRRRARLPTCCMRNTILRGGGSQASLRCALSAWHGGGRDSVILLSCTGACLLHPLRHRDFTRRCFMKLRASESVIVLRAALDSNRGLPACCTRENDGTEA